MLLALAVALPFMLLTAGIVWQLANNERETRREAILFSTRTLMNAVDTILSKQIAVAQMLATSPALAGRRSAGVSPGGRARDVRPVRRLDRAGRRGRAAAHQPGAGRRPSRCRAGRRPAWRLQRRALETGQVQISGVFNGAVLQSPVVTVEVPVLRKDKPPLGIIIGMEPSIFLSLFEQWNLPEGWLAGLIDRNGNFIARSRNHDAERRPACIRRFPRGRATAAPGLERDAVARGRHHRQRPCHLAA